MTLRNPLLGDPERRGSINGDEWLIPVRASEKPKKPKPSSKAAVSVLPQDILQIILDFCETSPGYGLLREWSDTWNEFFLNHYCSHDKELLRQFAETILQEQHWHYALKIAINNNIEIRAGIETGKLAARNKCRWTGAGLLYTGLTATFSYWAAVDFPEDLNAVSTLRKRGNTLYSQMQETCNNIFNMHFCVIKKDLPWQPDCHGPVSCHAYDPYMLDFGNYAFYQSVYYVDTLKRDLQQSNIDPCTSSLYDRLFRCSEAHLTNYTNAGVEAYAIRDSAWGILASGSLIIGLGACIGMLVALYQKYHGREKVFQIMQGYANAEKSLFTSSVAITDETPDPDEIRTLLTCIAPADEKKTIKEVRDRIAMLEPVYAKSEEVRPQAYCEFFKRKVPDPAAAPAAPRNEALRRGCILL